MFRKGTKEGDWYDVHYRSERGRFVVTVFVGADNNLEIQRL